MVSWRAIDALSHQFELCGIGPATTAVALVDRDEVDELVRIALARLRADAVTVHPIAEGPTARGRAAVLEQVAAAVDIVIDATGAGIDLDQRPSDLRWLRVTRHALDAEYPPNANLARRVEALVDDLRDAQQLVLSDPHGGELVVDLAGAAVRSDDGLVAAPGTHGTYPSGWVEVVPAADTVRGDVVLMPGDTNVTRRSPIGSPTRLTVLHDLLTAIDGDHADGDVIRALIESFDDPLAYGVATLTLGLHATPSNDHVFDHRLNDPTLARLTGGVVTLSFGHNERAGRPGPGRVTLGLRHRTVQIDEATVVHDGQLWGPYAPDVYERLD